MKGPFPGAEGQAPYCRPKGHTYRTALQPGDPKELCINCGWVRGQRKKKA